MYSRPVVHVTGSHVPPRHRAPLGRHAEMVLVEQMVDAMVGVIDRAIWTATAAGRQQCQSALEGQSASATGREPPGCMRGVKARTHSFNPQVRSLIW